MAYCMLKIIDASPIKKTKNAWSLSSPVTAPMTRKRYMSIANTDPSIFSRLLKGGANKNVAQRPIQFFF